MTWTSEFTKLNLEKAPTEALQLRREKAQLALAQLGLPTKKLENWKYTSVKELIARDFQSSFVDYEFLDHEGAVEIRRLLSREHHNLVFVNGKIDRELSDLDNWPSEVQILFDDSADFATEFEDGLQALHGIYSGVAVSMTVNQNVTLQKPIHVVYFHSCKSKLMSAPLINFKIKSGSSAVLLESTLGTSSSESYFNSSVMNISVEANASLEYLRLQNGGERSFDHGKTVVTLKRDSRFTSLIAAVDGQWGRHRLIVHHTEPGSSSKALGVYLVTGQQHIDNMTTIQHQVGHCNSSQLYKGILDGESRAVFAGQVFIAKDAQKANSEQLNNNLLLSSRAEVDSKPELMIEADDVKATHGSTVGQLNRDELFYLESRGISRRQAIPMLSFGYLAGVIEHVESSALKSYLYPFLEKSFTRLEVK